jgi:hypothetical protein
VGKVERNRSNKPRGKGRTDVGKRG